MTTRAERLLRVVPPGLEPFPLVTLVMLATLGAPATATAEPAAPATENVAQAPTAAQLDEARAQFKAGLQLEKEGKFGEALPLFEAVAAVKASAQVRFHVGLCNERLGRLVAAIAAYDAAAEQAKRDGNAPEVLKVVPGLSQRLRDKLPLLSFGFVGDVFPDTLTLDGKPLDLAALKDLPVDPGAHVIVAKKGAQERRTDVSLGEGDRKVVRFKLDGGDEAPAMTDAAERVPAPPKPTEAPPANPGLVTTGWVVTGLGVASLGASLVFWGVRGSKLRTLEDACDGYRCPSSAQGAIDDAHTMTTLSRVALGVGLGAAATGATLLVLGYGRKAEGVAKPSYLRLVPFAPDTQVGVGFQGAF